MRMQHLVILGGALAAACAAPGCNRECGAPGTVCTVVGTGAAGLDTGEGTPALDSPLYDPVDVTFGPDGDAYVVDWNNHRIRRWSPTAGTVTTVAGVGGLGGDGPPGPALVSMLNHPTSVTFDGRGDMLIGAWHNRRVKRVNLSSGLLEDVCGTGVAGFAGDGGPAETAQLDLPVNVAVDASGVLFIADQNNNRIRLVDGSDIISTYAGTGLGTPSGPAATPGTCIGAFEDGTLDCFRDGPIDPTAPDAALLNNWLTQSALPGGRIALDAAGDLYIADTANNAIRKIDRALAFMTTIAGLGPTEGGYSGDGGPAAAARLSHPTDLEVAPDGTLYVADTDNHCIRAIAPDGNISTVAGVCGTEGAPVDGAKAAEALFKRPFGITLGPDGNLYVADTQNDVVRVVYLAGAD